MREGLRWLPGEDDDDDEGYLNLVEDLKYEHTYHTIRHLRGLLGYAASGSASNQNQARALPAEFFHEHGNTKRCPNCGQLIERTEGCARMDCTCSYTFCWECGAPYDGPEGIREKGNDAHESHCPYHSDNLPGVDLPTGDHAEI